MVSQGSALVTALLVPTVDHSYPFREKHPPGDLGPLAPKAIWDPRQQDCGYLHRALTLIEPAKLSADQCVVRGAWPGLRWFKSHRHGDSDRVACRSMLLRRGPDRSQIAGKFGDSTSPASDGGPASISSCKNAPMRRALPQDVRTRSRLVGALAAMAAFLILGALLIRIWSLGSS